MISLKNGWRISCLTALTVVSATAQSEHVVLPQVDWTDPVTFSMTGEPTYYHRHRLEVEGVPAEQQEIYQGSWSGELGMRIMGLKDETYRVHLGYTEMDMNAPRRRVFDILINGQVVQREVCIFNEVGNRRVLSFDFEAKAQDGVLTFSQRKSVPAADVPVFFIIQGGSVGGAKNGV